MKYDIVLIKKAETTEQVLAHYYDNELVGDCYLKELSNVHVFTEDELKEVVIRAIINSHWDATETEARLENFVKSFLKSLQ